MESFFVSQVIDGDTFSVAEGWEWRGQTGDRVRPTGYNAPESGEPGHVTATRKLASLISGRMVQIGAAYRVDRGRLVADVYLNGRNLASYFPEYS